MRSIASIALALIGFAAASVQAQPAFGELYYDGAIVRTIVPPAAAPKQGRDNIYPIVGGVEGQLPVAAVAPGDRDYHGGKWAVHVAMWLPETVPYLLTSEYDVLTAEDLGYVAITRVLEADFKCPIQP